MITRAFFLLILTVLLPHPVAAESQNLKFQEANGAYSKNDFATAITIYESLLAEHGYSPGVLYNLANSYAKAGFAGKAVLNYERALRLSPGDSDIIANLEKVQNETGLFTESEPVSRKIATSLSMNQWGLVILVALSAITATIVASLYRQVSRRTITATCLTSAMLILLAALCMKGLTRGWHCSIIISSSPLLISPFDGAAKVGTAQEGRRVFPAKQHGSYVYIESETGRTGWLPAAVMEPVVGPDL